MDNNKPGNVHFKKSAYITYIVKIITSKFTGRVNLINCNMYNTKLFKFFNKWNCFFVISFSLSLIHCSTKEKHENPSNFLKGKWKFISVGNQEVNELDSISAIIYEKELLDFLSGAYLEIKDSTYKYSLGEHFEIGKWRYHSFDSVLSLKSDKAKLNLFKVNTSNKLLFLTLKNSVSKEYWILEK